MKKSTDDNLDKRIMTLIDELFGHQHQHTSDCIDEDDLIRQTRETIKDFAEHFNISYKDARKIFIRITIKAKEQ